MGTDRGHSENISSFEKFWEHQHDPGYFHKTEDWVDRYYDEFRLFFPEGRKAIVDAGCGSGDLLLRMSKEFESVIGIDFSEGMLQTATERLGKESISNVHLHRGSITEINQFVPRRVDVILSNQVMQYLTVGQIKQFMKDCRELLQENGVLLLLNIPNANLRHALEMGVFHKQMEKSFSSADYLKFLAIRSTKDLLKKIVKRTKYDLFGFWHAPKDIVSSAKETGFSAMLLNSLYSPYGYRFHVVLKKV